MVFQRDDLGVGRRGGHLFFLGLIRVVVRRVDWRFLTMMGCCRSAFEEGRVENSNFFCKVS